MLPVNPQEIIPQKEGVLPLVESGAVKSLEKWPKLPLSEKISLLALLAHRKWTTELFISPVPYAKQDVLGKSLTSDYAKQDVLGKSLTSDYKQKIGLVRPLLQNLGFAFQENWLEHRRRGRLEWVQVATNGEILRYLTERGRSLTTLEAGALYGYPESHVLAFLMMIPRHPKQAKTTPAQFYLAGCYSIEKKKEEDYFQQVWREMTVISPRLIEQAERDFFTRYSPQVSSASGLDFRSRG